MTLAIAIDLETTGFGFKKSDRIVEIAGVIFEIESGSNIATFETLINPLRNVPESSSKIHGLTASHLSMSPTFAELAPWLAHTLSGKRIVAHNALFDVNFLNAEFARAGIEYSITEFDCTCRMSNNSSLRGAAIDLELDYEPQSHHGALYDAKLCSEIYKQLTLSNFDKTNLRTNQNFEFTTNDGMPAFISRQQLGVNRSVQSELNSLALGIDHHLENEAESCYLWRLADYLSDLVLTARERSELDLLADSLGISEENQGVLHRKYIRQLEKAALRDGLVTEAEQRLLTAFSEQLSVPLEIDISNIDSKVPAPGSLICVTGTTTIDGVRWGKAEISAFLENRGYVFTDEMNKSAGITLLLQESEGSQSGKIEKARKWGIPRMTLEKFIAAFAK
jgi:DNA polymerase-3 subunit epsilon